MNTRLLAEPRKTSVNAAWAALRPASSARAFKHEEVPAGAGSSHDFSRLSLLSSREQAAFASCPISATSPQACPLGGACHECPAPRQAKLSVGQPGDRFEQEADRVAEEVIQATGASPARNLANPPSPQVQRRCARCAEEDEELQAKAEPGAEADSHSVRSAGQGSFGGGGQPLDHTTRRAMESGFGYNFGGVRVHTDERAAAAAGAVRALAFTLGSDIVFGPGCYAPTTRAGRRLLAHELAHVVQQRAASPNGSSAAPTRRLSAVRSGGVQRTPLEDRFRLGSDLQLNLPPPPPLLYPGDLREAYVLPAIPAVPELRLELGTVTPRPFGSSFGSDLRLSLPPPLFSPVTIIPVPRCVPERALTWSDFTGTPSGAATDAAFTSAAIPERDVQGNVMFQAVLDSSRSWVRAKYRNPTDHAVNGAAAQISACEGFFQSLPTGHTGSWHLNPPAGPSCAAAILPSTTAAATSRAECTSVIGAEIDRVMPEESARVLRHEQTHFDIACVLVGKADDALAAGADLATVRSRLTAVGQPTQDSYDADTSPGCIQSAQDTWEADVANLLPSITIP